MPFWLDAGKLAPAPFGACRESSDSRRIAIGGGRIAKARQAAASATE